MVEDMVEDMGHGRGHGRAIILVYTMDAASNLFFGSYMPAILCVFV